MGKDASKEDFEKMSGDDKETFEKEMKDMWHGTTGDHDEELFNHLFEHGDGQDGEHQKDGEHPTEDEIRGALGKMGMSEDDIGKSHEKFEGLDEATQMGVMGFLGRLVDDTKDVSKEDFEKMSKDDKKKSEKEMKEMWKGETGDDDEELFKHLFEHGDGQEGEHHDDEGHDGEGKGSDDDSTKKGGKKEGKKGSKKAKKGKKKNGKKDSFAKPPKGEQKGEDELPLITYVDPRIHGAKWEKFNAEHADKEGEHHDDEGHDGEGKDSEGKGPEDHEGEHHDDGGQDGEGKDSEGK